MGAFFPPRRYVLTSFIILTSIVISPASAHCQEILGNLRFLLFAPDARGKSLAGGGSAFSKGAASAYYNPALLAASDGISAEVNYCKYLPLLSDDFSISNFFVSTNIKGWGHFGIGFTKLGYEYDPYCDDGCCRTRNVNAYSLGVYYARSYDNHNSYGIGIKYIKNQDVLWSKTTKSSSIAMDFGLLSRNHFPRATWKKDDIYYPHLHKLFKIKRDRGFSIGISLSNLGGDLKESEYSISVKSLPRRLRIAAGYQAVDSEPVGLRLTADATKLLLYMDDSFSEEWSEIAWSYGLESTFYYIVTFRLGRLLDRGAHQRYTAIGCGLGPEWLGVDYSYVLESDEHWNRSGKEYSISINCNISPKNFKRN